MLEDKNINNIMKELLQISNINIEQNKKVLCECKSMINFTDTENVFLKKIWNVY